MNTNHALSPTGSHWLLGVRATALHARMPITWSESLALEIIGIQTRSLASSLEAAAPYSLVIPGKTPLSSKKLFSTSVSAPGTQPARMTQSFEVRASWPLLLPVDHSWNEVPGL